MFICTFLDVCASVSVCVFGLRDLHLCIFVFCVGASVHVVSLCYSRRFGCFSSFSAPWRRSTGGSGVKEGEFRISIRERGERTWTKERLIEGALLRRWTHIWLAFLCVHVVNCVLPVIHDVCMCVTKALTLENLSKRRLIKRDYKENLHGVGSFSS